LSESVNVRALRESLRAIESIARVIISIAAHARF
jgi:hypothetical protein